MQDPNRQSPQRLYNTIRAVQEDFNRLADQHRSTLDYFIDNIPSYEVYTDLCKHCDDSDKIVTRYRSLFVVEVSLALRQFEGSTVYLNWLIENSPDVQQVSAEVTPVESERSSSLVSDSGSTTPGPLSLVVYEPVPSPSSSTSVVTSQSSLPTTPTTPSSPSSGSSTGPLVPLLLTYPGYPRVVVNMSTFKNCSAYYVMVASRQYVAKDTIYLDVDTHEVPMAALRADKISRALLSGDRSRLKLEGVNKTRQYEDFVSVFDTIVPDYNSHFSDLINIKVDQHESITNIETLILAAPRAPDGTRSIPCDPTVPRGTAVSTSDVFKFSIALNFKLYAVLMLVTEGHAHEIVMRITDNDGRKALFMLRADAMKQTDGQVISLQNQINASRLLHNKHPGIALDKLQRLCKELDDLLKFQDETSQFGTAQTKAAIMNSLPSRYESFAVAREQLDSRNISVDSLITSIVNHYTTHVEKDNANGRTQAVNPAAPPPTKNQRRKTARALKKTAASLQETKESKKRLQASAKSEAEKAKANSNIDNQNPVIKDCIICGQLDNPPNDRRHLFRDCPTLKKVRNMGASGSRSNGSADESAKSGKQNSRKGKHTASCEVNDLSDSD